MDKVEFVGTITDIEYGPADDDDDGFCPSDSGRSMVCCSPGLD